MRRRTARVEQLHRTLSVEDERLRGPSPWERLPFFWFHLFLSHDCTRRCESRSVCQGGCPNDRLVLTGSTLGRSVLCEVHREIIPRLQHLERAMRARGAGPPTPGGRAENRGPGTS